MHSHTLRKLAQPAENKARGIDTPQPKKPGFLTLFWAATTLLYVAFGRSFVEACYRGESIGALNRIVAQHRSLDPEAHNLEFYQQKRITFFIEGSLLLGLVESFLLLKARRPILFEKVTRAIRNFFMSVGHPVNLSVFRIVFFGFFAWWIDLDNIIWFSQLPRELRVPPIGFGWFLNNEKTFDPVVVNILGLILRTACITASVGLFARSSAFVVAAVGFFLCGIPQSYGKIDSYHFMIWFALLLSVSRCADILSVDALVQRLKRADRTITVGPEPSLCYGLPLRFVWTLMGVTYFFGGLWKLIDGRWNWIFSENLRNHIFIRCYAIGRIPHFEHFLIGAPRWFFQLSAVATIVFELSFPVLILFPRTRILAAVGGLFFHNVLGLLMANTFWHLQVCYASFVDWHRIFRWFGQHCFGRPVCTQKEIQYSDAIPAGNTATIFGWRLISQPLILVGVGLIATNTFFSLFKLHGWPFACGPTHNHIATPTIRAFAVERVDRAGYVSLVNRSEVFKGLSGERLSAIYDNIYRHPERPELAMAFCGFLRRTIPGWADAPSIRFYVERVSVLPTERSKNPLQRKLFFECKQ